MADLQIQNHGSIFIMTPTSKAGHQWVDECIPVDATRWGQCSIVIEPRYLENIIDGACCAGLSIGG